MKYRTGKTEVWGQNVPRAAVSIAIMVDRPRLRQLLQLCHPDKHGNSKTSQEVTQWLLEARQKLDDPKLNGV